MLFFFSNPELQEYKVFSLLLNEMGWVRVYVQVSSTVGQLCFQRQKFAKKPMKRFPRQQSQNLSALK